jgi:N4-gp56 family major capsid protein
MAQTIIGAGDSKAVKRYSVFLASEHTTEGYFDSHFVGVGEEAETPIQQITQLEKDQGDQVTYDLVLNLKQQPTEGDSVIKGSEENLSFYTDNLYIDQIRAGVNCGGKMTRKRTIHNLRKVSLARKKPYWARVKDELFFMYLSGSRGTDTDWVFPTTYTGFAGNALTAPDTDHIAYGGTATAKANVTNTDKMSLAVVDKVATKAKVIGGGTAGTPAMVPCRIDGEEHFVLVMHPIQAYDMRTSTTTGNWLDIRKSLDMGIGNKSPIAKGGLGVHNNVILHEHKTVVGFTDYGAGTNLAARRALFLGRQAAVIAYGSPNSSERFEWTEEMDDRGNQLVIVSGCIKGIKKATFNSKDFGVVAIDTYAAAPY